MPVLRPGTTIGDDVLSTATGGALPSLGAHEAKKPVTRAPPSSAGGWKLNSTRPPSTRLAPRSNGSAVPFTSRGRDGGLTDLGGAVAVVAPPVVVVGAAVVVVGGLVVVVVVVELVVVAGGLVVVVAGGRVVVGGGRVVVVAGGRVVVVVAGGFVVVVGIGARGVVVVVGPGVTAVAPRTKVTLAGAPGGAPCAVGGLVTTSTATGVAATTATSAVHDPPGGKVTSLSTSWGSPGLVAPGGNAMNRPLQVVFSVAGWNVSPGGKPTPTPAPLTSAWFGFASVSW